MNDERRIDPNHDTTRAVLRVVGPATLGVGLVFMAVGLVSFFRSFGGFEPPRYFWCAFVGIPLTWLGAALCQFGYLGAVGRYVMGEMAPVQKDAFNVVARGARPGVEALARAVGQALGHNPFAPVVPCHRILGAGGWSGGFSAHGGALTKMRMLTIEGACPGGTPSLFPY